MNERVLYRDPTITHVEDEGEWDCSCAPAGDDDDNIVRAYD